MDDKNCIVRINDEAHLKQPTTTASADNIESVAADFLRIRRTGIANYRFRFFRRDAMFGDVVDVPINPSEHGIPPHNLIMEESQVESSQRENTKQSLPLQPKLFAAAGFAGAAL